MARPSKLYLLSYNSLQSLGWFIALIRLLPCPAPPLSVHSAYAVAGGLICLLQTCAILETVHAAIRSVPTGPLLAFLQWGGRTHFVIAVVRQIPEVQSSPSVFITFVAWSISEVHCFYPVVSNWSWSRRNVDYVPALPFVKERNLYSGFFKKFSMSYHSFLVGVLVIYPFLWLKLYLHVFKQRRAKLGKVDRKKRA